MVSYLTELKSSAWSLTFFSVRRMLRFSRMLVALFTVLSSGVVAAVVMFFSMVHVDLAFVDWFAWVRLSGRLKGDCSSVIPALWLNSCQSSVRYRGDTEVSQHQQNLEHRIGTWSVCFPFHNIWTFELKSNIAMVLQGSSVRSTIGYHGTGKPNMFNMHQQTRSSSVLFYYFMNIFQSKKYCVDILLPLLFSIRYVQNVYRSLYNGDWIYEDYVENIVLRSGRNRTD